MRAEGGRGGRVGKVGIDILTMVDRIAVGRIDRVFEIDFEQV